MGTLFDYVCRLSGQPGGGQARLRIQGAPEKCAAAVFWGDGLSIADGMGQLDGGTGIVKSESSALEDMDVAFCVEVLEAIGDLDFVSSTFIER